MKWDVVGVKPEPDSTLRVRFADGLSGRVRFSPEFFTGVFEPMFTIQLGTRHRLTISPVRVSPVIL
jgi:hypothetical protein